MPVQTWMMTDFVKHPLFITVIPQTTSHNMHLHTIGYGSAILWFLVDLISISVFPVTDFFFFQSQVWYPKINPFSFFLSLAKKNNSEAVFFCVLQFSI